MNPTCEKDERNAAALDGLPPPPVEPADAEGRTFTSGELGGPPASGRRAAVWTVAGFGSMQVLRLAFNLTLAQLVAPRVFGVMALINVFLQLLHMFSDLGIRQCVIAHPRGDDPAFLRTAWTMQAMRGVTLWLLSLAVAWPVAAFYDNADLLWLIPVAGLTALLDGFGSTNIFVLTRRMYRARLVILELGSYMLSMVGAVTLVWLAARMPVSEPEADRFKLTALIGAGLVSSIIQTVTGYFLMRGIDHRFAWDREAARDLWHYGGWVFLNTACYFLAGQADRLVIGKANNQNELGVYNLAAQLSLLPLSLVYELCNQLGLPLYSRLIEPGGDLGRLRAAHRTMGLVAAYMLTGLIAIGPTFFRAFFKPEYHGAGLYVQILAAGTWFAVLQYMSETVLIAQRRSRPLAFAQMAKLTLILPCMWLGWRWGGLMGLVIGFKAPEVFRYSVLAFLVAERGLALFCDDLLLTSLIAIGSTIVLWLEPQTAPQAPLAGRFAIGVGLVSAFWAAVYAIWQLHGRASWRMFRNE